MTRVLLVEDDEAIRRMVVTALTHAGYEVVPAEYGEEGLAAWARDPADVVVLDIRLPGRDGLDVCRTIRATSTVPIMMLTARVQEEDVVHGLEIGADDYLTKPFSVRELLARVGALARRSSGKPKNLITVGDLAIEVERHVVTVSGAPVELTPTEFRLLCTLAKSVGQVVSPKALLREAQDYECDDREAQDIVKVHIRHLRHKIEPDPESPAYIVNVRGFGYRMEAPPSRQPSAPAGT